MRGKIYLNQFTTCPGHRMPPTRLGITKYYVAPQSVETAIQEEIPRAKKLRKGRFRNPSEAMWNL